ncbi:hypothetical protein [Streptomyces sp. NPDC058401]|uniref:hypothetical protein n=1 Tax=Streptomyces sp. NPDC058401 TaxID=3346480 RepID=UPI00364F4D1A
MTPPRTPRTPRTVLTTSAAVLALLLTGCSQSGGDTAAAGKEPEIGTVPVLLESRNLTFPVDAYFSDHRQQELLTKAQDVLVDQCMQRFGFRYQVQRKSSGATPPQQDNSRRYGISDPAEAAQRGYASPRDDEAFQKPPQPERGPNERLVLQGLEVAASARIPMNQEEAEASDVATTVVAGQKVPAGGCMREAYLKLFSPTKNTVDPKSFEIGHERAEQDSRVVKVIKEWSACMAEHGYEDDSPMGRPPGIDPAKSNGPEAIAIAKQDVECKRKTNLVGIRYTVELAYQKRGIEKNAEGLNLAKQQLDARMKLAASLVSGS